MITQHQLDHYRDNGFIRPQSLLTAAEAARYRAACEDSCIEVERKTHGRHPNARVKPYLLFPWAAELVRHPKLLDMLEAIIGPDILVFHTTVWIKEGGSDSFVPWHQDGTYFGLEPFEQITAWVALTRSTREMGCLRFLPGSHREGQVQHRDTDDEKLMLSRGQTIQRRMDEAGAVHVEFQPGEVSFHHTLAMHTSGPNRSTERRIGIGISYIPAHVRHAHTPVRLSASLVRGRNRYGHFDLEPRPEPGEEEAAVATHADSIARFWRASEHIPEMRGIH